MRSRVKHILASDSEDSWRTAKIVVEVINHQNLRGLAAPSLLPKRSIEAHGSLPKVKSYLLLVVVGIKIEGTKSSPSVTTQNCRAFLDVNGNQTGTSGGGCCW